jgi:hypothetical protein
VTLAGLITFALAHLFELPQGYWAGDDQPRRTGCRFVSSYT